jgi:glycosyltransferase involved in cell wall biosynthesis
VRVLLATPWYFPESAGGTEVYVQGLARELRALGVAVAVAAPTDGVAAEYLDEDIPVFRFADPSSARGELALDRPVPDGWCEILDRFKPDVVHLHSLSSTLDVPHLRAARARHARTVATLHLPGIICGRGTFMRFGKAPCPGDIAKQPCTACRLNERGVPAVIGHVLAVIPQNVRVVTHLIPAFMRRALTAGHADLVRRTWLAEFVRHTDRLVAPSKWLVNVLCTNGVEPHRIAWCPQGVDRGHVAIAPQTARAGTLRVGFVGRYDRHKGLHTLIDAMKSMPSDCAIELHVWGIARAARERSYRDAMIARAAGSRVIFHDETPRTAEIYRQIDVLAVPSESMETGPLVVIEAQAAGVPVVGSNIGGIAERITDGEDGILFPPGRRAALTRVLRDLASDPSRLAALRPKRPPRTMTDVARETCGIYESLAATHAA